MSKSSGSIGFAVVGAGFMGKTHSQSIKDHVQNAHLVGVLDTNNALTEELANTHKVKKFSSLEEMVSDNNVDAVVIATPHAHHYKPALAAAEAGKHLLIEKPMACSVEQCDGIIKICQVNNLKCSITYTQRARIGSIKAKELIDSGKLGKVLHIRTYQMVPGGIEFSPDWQMQPENIGILLGHGIHNIDACRWFTGQEIKTVYAKCRNLNPTYPLEATSDVLLTMEDGTVGYILSTFEVIKPGFPRSEIGNRIICEKGLLDIDPYDETRVSIEGADWETITVQPKIDFMHKGFLDPVRLESYARIEQDLVDSILENRQTAITAWDGRQAVAAAMASYESSNTGREIILK